MTPQKNFFNRIRDVIPAHHNLANSISETLNISINEAYKKIRGDSFLNIKQIVQLSDAFSVPFYYKSNRLSSVTFDYSEIDKNSPDMLAYLKEMLENLIRIKQHRQKDIIITTDDVPLFHFFKYPELTCYKLFFWADNVFNESTTFEMGLFSDEIIDVAKKLNTVYLEIPSTEIWSKDTVTGTLEQIRYGFEAGFLKDKSLALKIIEQLRYCLNDISTYAVSSKKTIDAYHRFNWYHCDVLGSICYLVNLGEAMECYNRFNTFNYLKTNDQDYCQKTADWMNSLIKKSLSFSGHGEKHRNKYLYQAFRDCDCLIDEIVNQ